MATLPIGAKRFAEDAVRPGGKDRATAYSAGTNELGGHCQETPPPSLSNLVLNYPIHIITSLVPAEGASIACILLILVTLL